MAFNFIAFTAEIRFQNNLNVIMVIRLIESISRALVLLNLLKLHNL